MKLKNRIKSFFIVALMFAATSMQAQFDLGQFEDLQTLKEITLLVVLETPNERKVKKLEKKDSL